MSIGGASADASKQPLIFALPQEKSSFISSGLKGGCAANQANMLEVERAERYTSQGFQVDRKVESLLVSL